MFNYDTMIDRQSLRGLSGPEVAAMIDVKPMKPGLRKLDPSVLKDIGFDNSSR